MRRFLTFTLLVAVVLSVSGDGASRRRAMLKQKVAAGGGSPAWNDAIDQTGTDTTQLASGGGDWVWQKITPTISGNCTKLRIYIGPTSFGGDNLKMGLYTSAGALLQSGTASTSGTSYYQEVTISSQAVTASTEYNIGFEVQSGNCSWRYLDSQPSGTSARGAVAYAAAPPDPLPSATDQVFLYAAGMYITP